MALRATRLPKYLLITTTLLLLTQLIAVSAQAQTRITTCGTDIIRQGEYILANDLSCPQIGITISTGGVTLKLNGHRINGVITSAAGIDVRFGHEAHILGPGTISGFQNGVRIGSNGPVEVTSVTAAGNSTGFSVIQTKVRLASDIASGGQVGFSVVSNDSEVSTNHASQNTMNGFFISGMRNLIHHNMADHSQYGIAVSGDMFTQSNRIHQNAATVNSVFDLFEGHPSCVNTWTENTFTTKNLSCIH